jgi:hypothetical protein
MVRRRLGEREKRKKNKRNKSEGIKVMKRNESDTRV